MCTIVKNSILEDVLVKYKTGMMPKGYCCRLRYQRYEGEEIAYHGGCSDR